MGRLVKNILDLVPFGKYMICQKRLKRNIVSLNHTNRHPVPKYPVLNISTDLKKCIQQILTNQPLDVRHLSEKELTYLKRLIKDSKLQNIKYEENDTKGDLKKQFELMTGVAGAGNDSKILKNQLSDLINKMVSRGMLTQKQGLEATKSYIVDV